MELQSIISNAVYSVLKNIDTKQIKKEDFDLIGLKEASDLTGYSIHTLYRFSSRHEIPFVKRRGGRKLFFSKKALQEWIIYGKNK
jgi:excisionase family DNA binding protein